MRAGSGSPPYNRATTLSEQGEAGTQKPQRLFKAATCGNRAMVNMQHVSIVRDYSEVVSISRVSASALYTCGRHDAVRGKSPALSSFSLKSQIRYIYKFSVRKQRSICIRGISPSLVGEIGDGGMKGCFSNKAVPSLRLSGAEQTIRLHIDLSPPCQIRFHDTTKSNSSIFPITHSSKMSRGGKLAPEVNR